MDNIILGLLLLQDRTIYQLRERIGKGIDLMYSSSTGSIQAAIKKLLKHGFIDYEEIVENGRRKKVYRITASGKRSFLEWVNSPMEEQNPKNPELAKVYFMGFSDRANREESIRHHLAFLKEQHRVLEAICCGAQDIEIADEHRDILTYQFVCARYGKDLIGFNISWYEGLLQRMEDGEL